MQIDRQSRIDESVVKRRFRDFVETPEFAAYFDHLYPPPRLRILFGILCILLISLAPVGLVLLFTAWKRHDRRAKARRLLDEFIDASRFLVTYPIMVNRFLLDRPGRIAGALVFGTTDRRLADDVSAMAKIGVRFGDSDADPSDPVQQAIASLLADEKFQLNRRRRLPDQMTGGRPVIAFDLQVPADYLPPAWDGLQIPCLADPRPDGSIYVVPWRLIEDMLPARPSRSGPSRRDR